MSSLKIRCSALPRILSCPASVEAPEIPIDTTTPAATIGTAFHEAIADHIANKSFDGIEYYAHKYDLAPDQTEELSDLFYNGRKMWDNTIMPQLLPGSVKVEERQTWEMPGSPIVELSGQYDAIAQTADQQASVIIDWKTGRGEYAYKHQLVGYALLLRMAYGDLMPQKIVGVVAYPRTRKYEQFSIDREDLNICMKRIFKIRDTERRPFAPFIDNCRYCPRAMECPACLQETQNAVAVFDGNVGSLTTSERLAAAYNQYCIAKAAIEKFGDNLRKWIQTYGPLPLENGEQLELKATERQTIMLTAESAASLTAKGIDLYGLGISIPKTDLMAQVAAQAGKGKGAAAKRDMMAELTDCGAVKVSKYDRLEKVKTKGAA